MIVAFSLKKASSFRGVKGNAQAYLGESPTNAQASVTGILDGPSTAVARFEMDALGANLNPRYSPSRANRRIRSDAVVQGRGGGPPFL